MLEIVEDGLERIVHKPHLFLVRFRGAAGSAPWLDTKGRLDRAKTMITQNEISWEYVAGVGLVGHELKWKRDLLRTEREQGTVGRFLKLANSFLGSLSKVLPVLEPVKEFKENIEACVAYSKRIND